MSIPETPNTDINDYILDGKLERPIYRQISGDSIGLGHSPSGLTENSIVIAQGIE